MELQTAGTATPAQKATKAAKMISYISKTQEKVDALIESARNEGVDPAGVKIVSRFSLETVTAHSFTGYETHPERS